MKRFKQIYWIGALLAGMLFPAIGNCEVYQVKMRDGRTMRVKQYYEKGDMIFLLRYNNYIGLDRNEVVEITKADDSTDAPDVMPKKKKASSATTAGSKKAGARASASQKANSKPSVSQKTSTGKSSTRKASGDKLKSAVEPVKRLTSGS
jgi:hypothetical protein